MNKTTQYIILVQWEITNYHADEGEDAISISDWVETQIIECSYDKLEDAIEAVKGVIGDPKTDATSKYKIVLRNEQTVWEKKVTGTDLEPELKWKALELDKRDREGRK